MVADGIFYPCLLTLFDFLLSCFHYALRGSFNEALYGIRKLFLQTVLQFLLFLFKFCLNFRLTLSGFVAGTQRIQAVTFGSILLYLVTVIDLICRPVKLAIQSLLKRLGIRYRNASSKTGR